MESLTSQRLKICSIAANHGYGNLILVMDEIELMESSLAFAVSPTTKWPEDSNLNFAGKLIRAWIALHLSELSKFNRDLGCTPVGFMGTTYINRDSESCIKLPIWKLHDRKGETGPLQVLFSEDPDRDIIYIQIGMQVFTGMPNQEYYRLLERLGESIMRYQHYRRFTLSTKIFGVFLPPGFRFYSQLQSIYPPLESLFNIFD